MIYDISQAVFDCQVFPGDSKPERTLIKSMDDGDLYNLTDFSMCAHNGTHVDAPLHFIRDGKSIGQIALEKFIGLAFVISHEGEVSADDAKRILQKAFETKNGAEQKILLKGRATISLEAAMTFANAGIDLIGNESQTVGPEDAPMPVHLVLLGAEVVLLEGIRLTHVPDGAYLLNAAPLNLSHSEGAPCRAVLLDLEHIGGINRT